jgi:hypothetical protein
MSTLRKMYEVVFMAVLLYKKFGRNLTSGCTSFLAYSAAGMLWLGYIPIPQQ